MITLVYPPATLPTSPYSSLPYLKGGLERLGYAVNCIDLNVEAYDYWLSSLFNKDACSVFQIEFAKEFLRSSESEITNTHKYVDVRNKITSFFLALNKEYKTQNLSFGGYLNSDFCFSLFNIKNLSEDLSDPLSNFYNYYLESCYIEDNYIGISATYDFQLLPSLLLAYMLKKKYPDKKIFLGGASIHYLTSFFLQNKWIFKIVDLISLGDGILSIVNYINDTKDYTNSMCLDKNGRVIIYENNLQENLHSEIILDYSGLPLEKYFTPTITGIILTSTGCYYSKCAFCVPSKGKNHQYCKLSINNIIENIRKLKKDLKSDIFFFGDDCLDINYQVKILETLNDPIFWQAEFRFERNLSESALRFLKEKGCLQILFGLESISQRVLDLMKKGTKLEQIHRIIDDCHKLAIRTNMQTIVGFPTETIDEAYSTIRFLFENKEKINSCAVSPFCLYQGSDVYLNPDKYEICITNDDHVCNYSQREGLKEDEKNKLSSVFFDSISEYMPYNTFFLDGPMGNHASIYYKNNIQL
jgi:radical SAM superfamily enzyme YgiQ (UPF0313 family)